MSFTTPNLLYLLVIPALLLAWTWNRDSRRVALPFDYGRQSRGLGWWTFVSLAESMPPLLLAVVLFMLAGPSILGQPKDRRALTNIEFCVDVSGSMTASFGEGTRYDASMKAINQFLDYREGDSFGLTFFGNEVLHWVPLTSDVSAFRCAPPFMNPKNPGHPPWLGGTMIGRALVACKDQLIQRDEGDRMIILVSDGSSFDMRDGRDVQIAKMMKDYGITVFGIHIDNSAVPDPIANVTGLTGGAVFSPGDPAALTTVFQRIDEMQETKIEKTAAEMMDFFFPFSIAGLSLLGVGLLSLFGLRYTPW